MYFYMLAEFCNLINYFYFVQMLKRLMILFICFKSEYKKETFIHINKYHSKLKSICNNIYITTY